MDIEPIIYDFKEFRGTKEQCIEWLGGFNLDTATQKLFNLDSELRQDFRPYFIQRSKDHLRPKF